MKKGFVLLLSLATIITSIPFSVDRVYAKDYHETTYVESVDETTESTAGELIITITKNDFYSFSAEKGTSDDASWESLEMTIMEEPDSCLITYKTDSVKLSGIQSISTLTNKLIFESEDYSGEELTAYEEKASVFLIDSMTAWNKKLGEEDYATSLEELGFMSWAQYAESLYSSEYSEADPVTDNTSETLTDDTDKSKDIDESDAETADSEETYSIFEDTPSEEDISSKATDFEKELIPENNIIVKDDATTEEETVPKAEEESSLEENGIRNSKEISDVVVTPGSSNLVSRTSATVERIATNYESISMKVGEKIKLIATAYPEYVDATPVWSAPSTYASVNLVGGEYILTANRPTSSPISVSVTMGSISKSITVDISSNAGVDTVDENGYSTVSTVNGYKVITADGIWVGNFCDSLDYTGSAIKQNINVYYKGEKLTLNKDYSLTYKNNVNQAPANRPNSPSVTVTMKGQYSGKKTLYYEIKPAAIYWASNNSYGMTVNYNGKPQTPLPSLSYNGKKLTRNKDFIIEYTPDSTGFIGDQHQVTKITYTLKGINNFSGVCSGNAYYIAPGTKNISKATLSLNRSYSYTGQSEYYNDDDLSHAVNLKIKLPGSNVFVDPVTDPDMNVYVTRPAGNVGKMIFTVESSSTKYSGSVSKTIPVTAGYKLSAMAELTGPFEPEIIYHKNPEQNKQPYSVGLQLIGGGTLYEGAHYKITYTGNTKVGTATMTFTGLNQYSGVIKKTYKIINPAPVLSVTPASPSMPYIHGGSKMPLTVTCNGETLVEKTDYTVTYTQNTNIGTANYKVTGKGNYAKAIAVSGTYTITSADISSCSVAVSDVAYTGKANAYKSKPTITSPNGKKLTAGKDYDTTFVYEYDHYDEPGHAEYNNPPAGKSILVKVTGKGNYYGTVTGSYIIYDKATNGMAKLYISIDNQTYTGKAINLDVANDIHIYTTAKDFKEKTNELSNPEKYVRIISYKNNIKSGTASVVLGSTYVSGYMYGGQKTVNFKILKKNYEFIPTTGISLSSSSINLVSSGSTYGETTLYATMNPSSATNKTVTWECSNTGVISIVSTTNSQCKIRAIGAGKAVITARTQDGNKTASCSVESIIKPLENFTLSSSSIQLKTTSPNNVAVLSVDYSPSDAFTGNIEWKSSDSSIVTVVKNGTKSATVTAKAEGLAVIAVTANGVERRCMVKVKNSGVGASFDVTDTSPSYSIKPETIAVPNDNKADHTGIRIALNQIGRELIIPDKSRVAYIPSGQYDIGPTTNSGPFELYKVGALRVVMESDTILKNMYGTNNAYMGNISQCSNITIENGILDGNCTGLGMGKTMNGLAVIDSNNVTLENVVFKNYSGSGLVILNDSTCNKITIKNCIFENCNDSAIVFHEGQNVTIENCSFINCGTAITIKPSSAGNLILKDTQIKNCLFGSNRSYDVYSEGVKNSTSIDVTFDKCSFYGNIRIGLGGFKFTNTTHKPSNFYNTSTGSKVFPN